MHCGLLSGAVIARVQLLIIEDTRAALLGLSRARLARAVLWSLALHLRLGRPRCRSAPACAPVFAHAPPPRRHRARDVRYARGRWAISSHFSPPKNPMQLMLYFELSTAMFILMSNNSAFPPAGSIHVNCLGEYIPSYDLFAMPSSTSVLCSNIRKISKAAFIPRLQDNSPAHHDCIRIRIFDVRLRKFGACKQRVQQYMSSYFNIPA
eukprot:6209679-Pleurochrysis_carterae.AAC.3